MVLFFPRLSYKVKNADSVISVTEDTKEHPFEKRVLLNTYNLFYSKISFPGSFVFFFPPHGCIFQCSGGPTVGVLSKYFLNLRINLV